MLRGHFNSNFIFYVVIVLLMFCVLFVLFVFSIEMITLSNKAKFSPEDLKLGGGDFKYNLRAPAAGKLIVPAQ